MPPAPVDPRLILSEDGLDGALETFLLAEASLWQEADERLSDTPLGRGHYRAAFLIKRRPGIGVKELARLTGLTKQAASRALKDLIDAGLAEARAGALDGRRRPTHLTPAGAAFEQNVSAALRARLAGAYRDGGIDAAPGARRILAAIAGPRALSRRDEP
jgi:DNA-binding MarR family transcriptional regulator